MAAQIADNLIEACLDDTFPDGMDTLKALLFDRLRSEEEAFNLLGVYIGLVKLHPDFRKDELITAIETNKLAEYIVRMHSDKYSSYYAQWFIKHQERFKK